MKELEKMLKKLENMDLGEGFETFVCAEAYKKGGIKQLYKETLKPKAKAKRDNKKDNGEEFTKTRFEAGYIASRCEKLINLIGWKSIVDSAEDRKVIADELTNLAEELRNL